MKVLEIKCKGIKNISARNYALEVTLEEIDNSFIYEIEEEILVRECCNQSELIKHIDEEVLHEHLRVMGYIYNKA